MERAAGATHAARIQPSDTAGPLRLGVMQGGIVVPLRAGHYVHVHGVVSGGSDCDTPKHSMRAGGYMRFGETSRGATATPPNAVCELLVTKRETGREAAGTWALSGMDKDGLGPSAPRNGHSFVLSFA